MNTEDIDKLFSEFRKAQPHPKTELEFTNAYTLLVAVVLSAQATDKGVNKATKNLFSVIDQPQAMLDLGENSLKEYIKTIGLFNTKAKNIIALSRMLVENYDGKVPTSRDDLQLLPGVGRKTANVILNVLLNAPTIPVDTHVFRVAKRLDLSKGSTPLAVEKDLENVIPDEFKTNAHHWLILHGRYICKAQKPLCHECFIKYLCPRIGI